MAAPDEWERGEVSVKQLSTGEQSTVPLDEVIES